MIVWLVEPSAEVLVRASLTRRPLAMAVASTCLVWLVSKARVQTPAAALNVQLPRAPEGWANSWGEGDLVTEILAQLREAPGGAGVVLVHVFVDLAPGAGKGHGAGMAGADAGSSDEAGFQLGQDPPKRGEIELVMNAGHRDS